MICLSTKPASSFYAAHQSQLRVHLRLNVRKFLESVPRNDVASDDIARFSILRMRLRDLQPAVPERWFFGARSTRLTILEFDL